MKKITIKVLAAILATAALPQVANAANLLGNGSFEADSQGTGSWNIYSNLTGWSGGAGGIELRNAVAGQAYDGSNYVELDSWYNSSASQTVATTQGQAYTLSFAYSPRMQVSSASNGIEVFWNGASYGVFTGDGLPDAHDWSVKTLTVVGGTNPLSTLTFAAVGASDGLGGSLDAVALAPVPEPETYGLMLAGLGLIGAIARRKQRTA